MIQIFLALNKIKPNTWFFIIWINFLIIQQIPEKLFLAPIGIHQGAQSDRACIAYNYYCESMNFFEPRVMEKLSHNGICGLEFPIVNYTAACLYKVFGFQHFWYRFLVLMIASLGVFYAFLLTRFFIQKTMHRLVVVFGCFFSPIFIYYSHGFIPDISAISFTFIGIYYYLAYKYNLNIKKNYFRCFLFFTLAGLIKITYFIFPISLLITGIILQFKQYKNQHGFLGFERRDFVVISISVVIIFSWYYYANYLTQKTQNFHFLQSTKFPKTTSEFLHQTHDAWNNWGAQLYRPWALIFISVLGIGLAIVYRKIFPFLSYIIITILLGNFAIFLMFNFQFVHHDYYFIIFYPIVFFCLILIQQKYLENRNVFFGSIGIAALIAFYYLPLNNFGNTKRAIKDRYTPGNYFYQQAFPTADLYVKYTKEIQQIIPKNANVYTCFDNTPNTSLYLILRHGVRIAEDFEPEVACGRMAKHGYTYFLINNEKLWNEKYAHKCKFTLKKIWQKEELTIYKKQ